MRAARDSRNRILRAAAEVFAARGYAAATTRAIGAAAGVNVALLNYYFQSKAELYRATVAMLFDDTAQPLVVLPDRVCDAPSWRRALRDWVRLAIGITAAEKPPHLWCARLLAQEHCLPSAMADEIHRLFAEPVYESLRRLIRMGMRRPDDGTALHLMFSGVVSQGLVYALHARWERLLKPPELTRQAWLDRVAENVAAELLDKLSFQGVTPGGDTVQPGARGRKPARKEPAR